MERWLAQAAGWLAGILWVRVAGRYGRGAVERGAGRDATRSAEAARRPRDARAAQESAVGALLAVLRLLLRGAQLHPRGSGQAARSPTAATAAAESLGLRVQREGRCRTPSIGSSGSPSMGAFGSKGPIIYIDRMAGCLEKAENPPQELVAGLKDTVPERPYHSNLCTSEFH